MEDNLMHVRKFWPGAYIVAVVLCVLGGSLFAQDYRIGPGDILEIRFFQDPNLNAQVRVSQDGFVTLDVIGEIKAAGKTTGELQNDIIREMSRFNTRVSQAVVRVAQYQYQYVFVKGQVTTPGKYTFEKIPDLWTILNEAGGITEFGDLSRVTIIRGGEEAGRVEIVNVLDAIENGKLDQLPKVGREDTIDIPRVPSGLPSADISQQLTPRKNEFYVIGAVNTPGPKTFQDNVDLLEALALAGGPSPTADLKRARIVTRDGVFAQTIEVNLEEYTKTGFPARYILRKEDTFVLPQRRTGFFGIDVGTVATIVGVISTAVIIYDRLAPDDPTVEVTTGP